MLYLIAGKIDVSINWIPTKKTESQIRQHEKITAWNMYIDKNRRHTYSIIAWQIVVVDRYEDYKIYLPTININWLNI